MIDADGYPTPEALEKIMCFAPEANDWTPIFHFASSIWNWGCKMVQLEFVDDKARWIFHTGGWSGNEDIIHAMQKNQLLWLICWESSTRGGRHEFIFKRGIPA